MNNVLVRIVLYVLSPLLTTLVAMIPGWGVSYANGVLSIDIATLAGAAVVALGLSGAVFARWGIR